MRAVTASWGQFRALHGVRHSQDAVVLDFGAGPRTYHPATKVLNLRPGPDGPGPLPVDWSQLDRLPALLTIEYAGPDRGIIDALATRHGIRFLYWSDAPGDIDLRATGVTSLRIGGTDLRSVATPRGLESLQLHRAPSTVRVEASDGGLGLRLGVFHYASDVVIPAGVRRVRELWLRVGGHGSASALADLTALEELTLDFDEPPGDLTDVTELGGLTHLHVLRLHSALGLAIDQLPELPALQELELACTRTSTAAAAQERYRNTPVTVEIWCAMTDEWLVAHLHNPFRNWVVDGEAFAQAACEACDRARTAIEAITPDDPDRLVLAEPALRSLVADLNVVNEQLGEIDTNYREQAGRAFHELARLLDIPEPQQRQWFDEGRRF
jgi:hypothetical protein